MKKRRKRIPLGTKEGDVTVSELNKLRLSDDRDEHSVGIHNGQSVQVGPCHHFIG